MSLNSSTTTAWADALASQYNNLRKDVIEKAWDRTITTWSTNAYVLTTDAQITAYSSSQRFVFQANFTNTASCTLNVNSLWAVAIKDSKNNDLWSWAITSWNEVEVIYDWSSMVVLSWVTLTSTNEWVWKIASTAEVDAWINASNLLVPAHLPVFPWTTNEYFNQSVSENNTYTYDFTRSWTYTLSFSLISTSSSFDYDWFEAPDIDGVTIPVKINDTPSDLSLIGSWEIDISTWSLYLFSTHITANKWQTFSITFPLDPNADVEGTVIISWAY